MLRVGGTLGVLGQEIAEKFCLASHFKLEMRLAILRESEEVKSFNVARGLPKLKEDSASASA